MAIFVKIRFQNIANYSIKILKICQKLLNLSQNGEISPNLVTLQSRAAPTRRVYLAFCF